MLTSEAAILREIDDVISSMNRGNATIADMIEQVGRRLEKIEDKLGIDPSRRPVLRLVYEPAAREPTAVMSSNGNGRHHELSRTT